MGSIGALLKSLFKAVLYQPLLNLLILFYIYLPGHDFGVAIIALTVVIRLALWPLMSQSIRSQKILSEIQPKIQELQKKYKDEKERQVKEIMALYKEAKINPFGSFLPLLIQFPILIALYQVFWRGFQPGSMSNLYSFVPNPGTIDPNFLGLINLAEASIALAFIAGITQFIQTKMMIPAKKSGGDQKSLSQVSDRMQNQMLYIIPVFTVFILWKLPAAIGLNWIVTSLFYIIQQYFILKSSK
jgi:YidC/Oxa1 family membrane protein insertase